MKLPWLLAWTMAMMGTVVGSDPCPPIEGSQPLLRPGNILLLGEIHGTVESPMFMLDMVCHAARSDLAVIVGLELPLAEQVRVDAFLDSQDSESDRTALLAGSSWQASYQDGR